MKRLLKTIISFMCLVLVLVTAFTTFGWFSGGKNTVAPGISQATIVKQYFHCGSGTASDPFVITRPIHYYHLVELYQRNSNFATAGYYFQVGYKFGSSKVYQVYKYDDYGNTDESLTDTLNLAYYSGNLSLIPIGTSQHPFDGKFDGKGIVINNLTITASEVIGDTTYASCDIGMFGYVRDGASIHDIKLSNLTIDLNGAKADGFTGYDDTSSVHDANKDTVKDTVCVGYIIGHLLNYTNASGINYVKNTASVNSTPIYNVYVNNAKVISGTQGSSDTIKSGFGYIGYVDRIDGESSVTVSGLIEGTITDGTGNQSWGGSIDMQSLYTRIKTMFGKAEDNSTNGQHYPTVESIYAPAKTTDYPSTSATSWSTSTMRNDSGSFYYWSALSDVSNGTLVNTTGGTIYGEWVGDWTYLYGQPEGATNQTTTKTKTGQIVDAYQFYNNGAYISYDGTQFYNSYSSKSASKWIPVSATSSDTETTAKYYMLVNDQEYYLTNNGTSGVTVTQTASSACYWTRNDQNEFYTTIGGTDYYLHYNGTWVISENVTRYAIGDGQGHFLSGTTQGVHNEGSVAEGSVWQFSNPSGATKIYFTVGTNKYYLTYDNALTVKTYAESSAPVWQRETNGDSEYFYYEVNNIKYYLIYDGGWKAVIRNGSKISSGDHYLSVVKNDDGTFTIGDANESDATLFQINTSSSGKQIVAVINGHGYYLTNVGIDLTVTETATNWTSTGDGLFSRELTISDNDTASGDYYLMYQNGWKIGKLSGFTITDKKGHYLSVDGTKIVNATSEYATVWQVVNYGSSTTNAFFYTMIGTKPYYLSYTTNGISIADSKPSWRWYYNGTTFYRIISRNTNKDRLYICYVDDEWVIQAKDSLHIHDNGATPSHYLTYRNTALVDGSKSQSPGWIINENTSTGVVWIYTFKGGTAYFLGISNSELSFSTTSTNWYHDANGYYVKDSAGTPYYLTFDEGSSTWKLTVLTSSIKLHYDDANGTHYLHTAGGDVGENLSQAAASMWIVDGQYIYTYIGTSKYYLTYKVETVKTYGDYLPNSPDREVLSVREVITPSISTTMPTNITWSCDTSSRYFATISGVKFYLIYDTDEGKWAFQETDFFSISNGSNYLAVSRTSNDMYADPVVYNAPTLTTLSSASYCWHIENTSNGKINIFTLVGDQKYYINHADATNAALPITFATTKTFDGEYTTNGSEIYYTSSLGVNYYIAIYNSSWYMVQSSAYFSIYANGKYMVVDSSRNITAQSASGVYVHRYFQRIVNSSNSNQYAISVTISGITYFLTSDASGALSFQSGSAVYWTKSGDNYYRNVNGVDYYLYCDGSKWMATPPRYYVIKSGSNYLAPSGTTGITSASSEYRWYSDSASTATSKTFYAIVSGTKYYLKWSASSGFSIGTSGATTFSTSGQTISTTNLSRTIYLIYDYSGWNMAEQTGNYITSNNTKYNLTSATAVTASTASNTRWYFTDSTNKTGSIYSYYNGKIAYWNTNGTNVTIDQTGATWSKDSSGLYSTTYNSTTYYAYNESSTCKVTSGDGFYLYSLKGTTKWYVKHPSSTNLLSSTTKNADTLWYMDSDSHIYYDTTSGSNTIRKYITVGANTSTSSSGGSMVAYESSSNAPSTFYYNSTTHIMMFTRVISKKTYTMQMVMRTFNSSPTFVYYFEGNSYITNSYNVQEFYFEPNIPSTVTALSFTSNSLTDSQKNIVNEYTNTPQAITFTNSSESLYKNLATQSASLLTAPTIVNIEQQLPNFATSSKSLVGASKKIDTSEGALTVTSYTVTPSSITVSVNVQNPKVFPTHTYDQLYVSVVSSYKRGTYLPLRLALIDEEDENSGNYSDYRASYKNSGYIVGGTESDATGSGQGDIRVSGYSISYIRNSYSSGDFTNIYTFNDSGTTPVKINLSANSYVNLEDTLEKFKDVLAKDSSEVYGLHFMDAVIDADRTIYAESVMIENKTYVNYELPESSIDFHVSEQGYIILYAGDYFSGGNDCFFSLNQVYRGSNNEITSIKEIVEIYAKPDMRASDKYVYKYSDNTYTNSNGSYTGATSLPTGYSSTPVFKMSWLTNPTNGRDFYNRYIYYFEIPCNIGEYALGSVEDHTGGYLLYLDIASNGVHGTTYNESANISSEPLLTQIGYTNESINSLLNIEYTVPANNADSFSVSVSYDSTDVVYDPKYGTNCKYFTIDIKNTTGFPMDLYVLLVDDDDDPSNDYNYRYKILYNGEVFTVSDAYDSTTGLFFASALINLTAQ